MSDPVRLWAYRCGRCTHHTLTIMRPEKCSACRKRGPVLAGYVEMTQWERGPKSYPIYPDPAEHSV